MMKHSYIKKTCRKDIFRRIMKSTNFITVRNETFGYLLLKKSLLLLNLLHLHTVQTDSPETKKELQCCVTEKH